MTHLTFGEKPKVIDIPKHIVDLGIPIYITSMHNYFEVEIGTGDKEKVKKVEKYFKDLGLA